MDGVVYDQAEILICDPVVSHRVATRSALHSMGFRTIESVSTLREFSSALKKRPPDLALCDFQAGGEDVCRIVQDLRQDPDSLNPFVVVLMTAWAINAELMGRIANSGVDGLLLRPFSTAVLKQRIGTFTSSRKGFVITSDYVGPERRSPQARTCPDVLFDPPNLLKIKTSGRCRPEAIARTFDEELRAARTSFQFKKLKCDSIRLCVLERLLSDTIAGEAQHEETLARMTALIASMEHRSRNEDHTEACGHLPLLREAAARLCGGEEYASCLGSFRQQAINLARIFHPERSTDQLVNEVMATVAIIRARENFKTASSALPSAIESANASCAVC